MTASKDETAPAGRGRRLGDQAWLLMMLPALFWAGNAVLGRAVAGEVPPIGLAFWRWTLGFALVLPFAWPHLRTDLAVMRRHWRIMLVLAAFGVAIFNTLLYLAAQSTTALNIVMLQTLMPVVIVAASFLLFGETIGLGQGIGVAVSLAGALVLVAQGDAAILARLDLNRGDLWMLGAVLSYALYTALLRRRPAVHGLSFLAATFALGALMLLPFYAGETAISRPVPLAPVSFLAIGYVAVFASILAYLSYNRAVALLGANRAGMAAHLVPVFGVLLAVVLLGERPQPYHAAGIALIAAGIWLTSRRRA